MKLPQKLLVILIIVLGLVFFSTTFAAYGDTKTWLSRPYSGDGGSPLEAYLDFPEDVVFDSAGRMYIADTMNNVIRRVENNKIYTHAGSGSYGDVDGAANTARFGMPKGIAVDSSGNVFVADADNNKIRKISNGKVTTFINSVKKPEGLAIYGKTLYIADTGNNIIKKVSTGGGSVSVVASGILSPKKLAIDSNGKNLFVTEAGRYRVIKIEISTGNVSLIAGSGEAGYKEGTGVNAQFRNLLGVAYDSSQNVLFVTDGDGYTDMLRAIDLSNNTTSLVSIDKVMATINFPKGTTIRGDYVYVANSGIGTIHKFFKTRGKWETGTAEKAVGKERFGNTDGKKNKTVLGRPYDMCTIKNSIYLATNNQIKKINKKTGKTSWVIGNVVDIYIEGSRDKARFSFISSITCDAKGKKLYITDHWNNRIRKIDLKTFTASLVSGSGSHSVTKPVNGYKEGRKNTARFNLPSGIVLSKTKKFLYVTDTANNRIRKVRISDGKTSLLAGDGSVGFQDGTGTGTKFFSPWGITRDKTGANLYIADRDNHAIRKINLKTKTVETVAGCGKSGYLEGIGKTACFSYPEYLKMGSDGKIYITEVGGLRVRVFDPTTKEVKLVAGSGMRGYKNGSRKVAEFNNPKGLLPDLARGRLLIADTWNDVIRTINIKGKTPYSNPAPQVFGVGPDNKYVYKSYSTIMLYIGGNNFRYGAKGYFGSQEVIKTYVNSDKKVVVKVNFGAMEPGYYDVTVRNVDGQKSTLKDGFIVLNSNGSLPSKHFRYKP